MPLVLAKVRWTGVVVNGSKLTNLLPELRAVRTAAFGPVSAFSLKTLVTRGSTTNSTRAPGAGAANPSLKEMSVWVTLVVRKASR